MVLYRKYRPQALSEVVGQDHVRDPLLSALKSGKITHAYLFSGPRGTGKTSVARILAKAVNCIAYRPQTTDHNEKTSSSPKAVGSRQIFGEPCNECTSCLAITEGSYLDLIEIDAASNRGIDEIRDLREKIKLSPAAGRFKVYIIDEAHMLTPEAFNALLKTLEEPPNHAIFILATTEPQRIPATIASRATRFDFKVPTIEQIKEKLFRITKKEGWQIAQAALEEMAKAAAGAFRDAEVLLEKVASVDPAADLAKTREILGRWEATDAAYLLKLIENSQTQEALIWLAEYLGRGGSIRALVESVLDVLRKTLLVQAGAESVVGAVTKEELEALKYFAARLTKKRLLELTHLFNRSVEELREATIPQLPLEIAIIEATFGEEERSEVEDTAAFGEASVGNRQEQVTADQVIKKTNEVKAKAVEVETEVGQEKTDLKKETVQDGQSVPAEVKTKAKENTSALKTEATGKILQKLQKGWGKFLKELKSKNSSLETFLRMAKPVDLDEDLLTIEFPYRFHKEKAEERKYRELLEEVLGKFARTPLRIKGVVGTQPPAPKKEESAKELGKEDVDPVEVFGKLD